MPAKRKTPSRRQKPGTKKRAPVTIDGVAGPPAAEAQWPACRWTQRLEGVFPLDGQYIEPLSERWRQARRGRLTASTRASRIYHRRPDTWARLMDELESELAPDWQWTEVENIRALDWGRQYEPAAIASIELATGADVTEPGLVFLKHRPYVAATPDAMLDGKVSVQIKCPLKPENHLEVLYTRKVPQVYFYQLQWEAWVTGAEELMFASYDHRQPLTTRLVLVDVPIDPKVVERFEANVTEFAALFNAGKRLADGKIVGTDGIPDLF